jgi:CRISPR system Cascade subunit CasE
MFFSLITPAPGHERAAAHDWARGAYAEHQWLWRFLPAPPGTPRSFLFRRRDIDGLPRFYVVSKQEPVPPSEHWAVRCKPYAPELAAGQWLQFELRANPVVTTRNTDGHVARHDVVMQEKTRLLHKRGHQRWAEWTTHDRPLLADLVQRCGTTWLMARGERLGVTFDVDALRADGYEQHRGKGDSLRISTIDFSGRLCVQEPQALQSALFDGVGRAKAFGCGLLLVKRALAIS